MTRKLIDDELLSLYKRGMLQKDIAKHFNVSPVAVCKRLKRLLPAPEAILSKHNLTEKERGFVIAKVNGKSNVQAVMNAYDVTSKESAKAMGTKLMDKPEIRQAIEELMETSGLSRSYRVQKLKEHVDNRDPGVSLRALDMSFRLDASYPPTRNVSLSASTPIAPIDIEVLERMFGNSKGELQDLEDD